MAVFVKFDPYAWLENQRQSAGDASKDYPANKPKTLAGLAGVPRENENQEIGITADHGYIGKNQKQGPNPR